MIVKGERTEVDVHIQLGLNLHGADPQESLHELNGIIANSLENLTFGYHQQVEVLGGHVDSTLAGEFDPAKIINGILGDECLTADERIETVMILGELAMAATVCNDDEVAELIVDSALERLSPGDPEIVEQWITTTLEY